MGIVPLGWSRTASTAAKLAMAERVLGYQFNNVDLLYEALDQKKQRRQPSGSVLSSGKASPRNLRLAIVGDIYAKLYLARKWYDNPDLTREEWAALSQPLLSNERFAEIAVKLGLDECNIPEKATSQNGLASTVEAIIAAVEKDGANKEQRHKVLARLGLEHRSIEPAHRVWVYRAVRSNSVLADKFFVGHHFKLQEGIFETKMKRPRTQRIDTVPQKRFASLWEAIRQMWQGSQPVQSKPVKQIVKRRALWRSSVRKPTTQSSNTVKLLPEGRRPAATEAITAHSKDVTITTGVPEILDGDHPSRVEDGKQAAAPEQTAKKEGPVKEHRGAGESAPEVSQPSKPAHSGTRSAVLKGDASADTRKKPVSPGSSQDSENHTAVNPSRETDAAAGVELEVEQPQTRSKANQVQPMEDGLSGEKGVNLELLGRKMSELRNKLVSLREQQIESEKHFRQLRVEGKKKNTEQLRKFIELVQLRTRLRERYAGMKELYETETLARARASPTHKGAPKDVQG